jgi:hypothetical protein
VVGAGNADSATWVRRLRDAPVPYATVAGVANLAAELEKKPKRPCLICSLVCSHDFEKRQSFEENLLFNVR